MNLVLAKSYAIHIYSEPAITFEENYFHTRQHVEKNLHVIEEKQMGIRKVINFEFGSGISRVTSSLMLMNMPIKASAALTLHR
jgi:hypothetical protein